MLLSLIFHEKIYASGLVNKLSNSTLSIFLKKSHLIINETSRFSHCLRVYIIISHAVDPLYIYKHVRRQKELSVSLGKVCENGKLVLFPGEKSSASGLVVYICWPNVQYFMILIITRFIKESSNS